MVQDDVLINLLCRVDFWCPPQSATIHIRRSPLRQYTMDPLLINNLLDFKRFSFRSVHPIGTPPEWKTCPDLPAFKNAVPATCRTVPRHLAISSTKANELLAANELTLDPSSHTYTRFLWLLIRAA
jgi:hypothetical protein